jgi:hypothetical protein
MDPITGFDAACSVGNADLVPCRFTTAVTSKPALRSVVVSPSTVLVADPRRTRPQRAHDGGVAISQARKWAPPSACQSSAGTPPPPTLPPPPPPPRAGWSRSREGFYCRTRGS